MESGLCSDIWVYIVDVYKTFQSLPIVCLKQTLKALIKSFEESSGIFNLNFGKDVESDTMFLEMIEEYYENPDKCYMDYYDLIALEANYLSSKFRSKVEEKKDFGFISILFPNSELKTVMEKLEETVLAQQNATFKTFREYLDSNLTLT